MPQQFASTHIKKIEYVNIAAWAQAKIEARMARISLKI